MDLLRRSASLFTPTPSPSPTPAKKDTPITSDDFSKAPSPEELFHQTTASADGPECEHDCSSCTIKYPARFDVDQEDTVYGNVDGWATHALVATGKTDWVRDVADEEGSLMEAVEKGGLVPANGVFLPPFSPPLKKKKKKKKKTHSVKMKKKILMNE